MSNYLCKHLCIGLSLQTIVTLLPMLATTAFGRKKTWVQALSAALYFWTFFNFSSLYINCMGTDGAGTRQRDMRWTTGASKTC
jgi:hypothetical protein